MGLKRQDRSLGLHCFTIVQSFCKAKSLPVAGRKRNPFRPNTFIEQHTRFGFFPEVYFVSPSDSRRSTIFSSFQVKNTSLSTLRHHDSHSRPRPFHSFWPHIHHPRMALRHLEADAPLPHIQHTPRVRPRYRNQAFADCQPLQISTSPRTYIHKNGHGPQAPRLVKLAHSRLCLPPRALPPLQPPLYAPPASHPMPPGIGASMPRSSLPCDQLLIFPVPATFYTHKPNPSFRGSSSNPQPPYARNLPRRTAKLPQPSRNSSKAVNGGFQYIGEESRDGRV
jgi:hypothetical protein